MWYTKNRKDTGMSNPNPQNQFKPGDPKINKNGRPKREWTWSGLLEKYADELEDNQKVKDAVVKKVFQLAKRGDMVAVKEIFNRMDGTPINNVDVKSDGKALPTPLLQGVINVPSDNSSEKTE